MERTARILLTRYSDWISGLVYYLTGRRFTHVSIALEDTNPYYYSFNFKGFCRETLEKHRRRGVRRSMELELRISEEAYQNISRRLIFVQTHSKEYRYTRLGLFCAVLRLPFRWRRHYFCSQFVADLLEGSGALPLSRPPYLCLPNHLEDALTVSPRLTEVRNDVV